MSVATILLDYALEMLARAASQGREADPGREPLDSDRGGVPEERPGQFFHPQVPEQGRAGQHAYEKNDT